MSEVPTRTSVLGTLVVIGVLAAVAFGAWSLWGGQPLPASARNVPPTGEAGRLAADPLALADFDAGTESYDHVRAFSDLLALKFLNDSEVAAYNQEGAGAARLTVSSKRPEGQVLVAVVRMADRDAALRAADRLDAFQFALSLTRHPPEQGVTRVAQTAVRPDRDPAARATVRAHYVHGDLLVRVQLNAKSVDLMSRFGPILAAQLKVLPADG
ncbi:hypothetical protein [Saccharothrix deserti]|uniref:hypothetical protein n=1 Tax=Saccharothrix deserti TaxID=2593674 RepID=UPI00131C476D|nr:hypothetical protein [Saccharothrix deserti]